MEKTKEMRRVKLLKLKIKLSKLKIIDEVLPYALIIVCVVSARFIKSELIVFLIYITSLVIYVWRRYDVRMFIGTAIFLLLTCAILLAGRYEKIANEVAVWVYYFLVLGAIGLSIDYLRGEVSTEKK